MWIERMSRTLGGHGIAHNAYYESLERIATFFSRPWYSERAESTELRIPSMEDRQGNSVGSRYRCGRGSMVVGPFGNLSNDGIRMLGSTLTR